MSTMRNFAPEVTASALEGTASSVSGDSPPGTFEQIDDAFRRFVEDPRFPCLGGKAAVRQGGYRLAVYGRLGSPDATDRLAGDLAAFGKAIPSGRGFTAFAAVFTDPVPQTEREFERRLWAQLQELHERDDPASGWDPEASSDPEDPRFSFSFAGNAYFVVGLHPGSSRLSRRFGWPALVFNPHAQFRRLREEGRFERLRQAIRLRDFALQGSINPNLADFGERSEAAQYSGRKSEAGWRCPFHRKTR